MLQRAQKHTGEVEKIHLTVDVMSTEAMNTSGIEGEILNRGSVQASIRRNFGLDTDSRRTPPVKQGIAEIMVDLYRTFDVSLSRSKLLTWHVRQKQSSESIRDDDEQMLVNLEYSMKYELNRLMSRIDLLSQVRSAARCHRIG
jgi:hypothetical protein